MDIKIEFDHYTLTYGRDTVLSDISLAVRRNAVLAIFGPAGGGKSGFLRSTNRMAELEPNERHQGDIRMDSKSVFATDAHLHTLRRLAARDNSLGRGQGSARHSGAEPFWRAAAAPQYRQGAGAGTRGAAARGADRGPRPSLDRQD